MSTRNCDFPILAPLPLLSVTLRPTSASPPPDRQAGPLNRPPIRARSRTPIRFHPSRPGSPVNHQRITASNTHPPWRPMHRSSRWDTAGGLPRWYPQGDKRVARRSPADAPRDEGPQARRVPRCSASHRRNDHSVDFFTGPPYPRVERLVGSSGLFEPAHITFGGAIRSLVLRLLTPPTASDASPLSSPAL